MTKLGFDATPLLGRRSGVGHYTQRLISAVMKQLPEWAYHLYSNRPLDHPDDGLESAVHAEDYLPASRWLWMQWRLPRAIRRDALDLCHFPNSLAPLNQPGPYVLTIHDASLFLFRSYHPWSRIAAMRLLLPVVARRAAAVITPSNVARRDLVKTLGLPLDRVVVIHEAAPDWFRPVIDRAHLDALRSRYALPDKFVLFVGTREPRKNLARLVRALQIVHRRGRRVSLVLVGPTGWHLDGKSSLAHLVGELAMEAHVHDIGYVPTADLPGLYSLATVFAYPSLYEGFGLPVVEAMACGAAVLTSRHTAMAEMCGDAAHLVDPASVDELAEGLTRLLEDADWRAELGHRALLQARRYAWDHTAAETIAVYRRLMNR